ncbi:leucine-rich repeat-containing protein 37A-like isoform X2 [Numida meleagris]|uniref:leucine-rich repeat-containing protein 37A-like isoform X2 n=1 Tax=Numida meleagris TaxID=8996 RepID=UPI000B3E2803|nr:leucine-rich repeat-containing protein 37A-like isoform X2 [Numida meleagris]
MCLPRPPHPFLFFLVLLLVTAVSPGQPVALCPASCYCHRWLLDCSRASMDTVPWATRHWALSVLNFTGNSISSIEKEAWREYPWAEHLDLSSNKILSIEEHAFEPLPFLQLLNLSGNLMAQIRKDTFQAWHGMQFLQKVILSHNPLSVIEDASFFQLPAVSYLDLGATRVSRLTVLTLLLTTARLEMLKLPRVAACCLCQEGHAALCRSVGLHGEELCASTTQCAHVEPPAETQAELRRAARCGTVLHLKATNSSLGDRETVTLAVLPSPHRADGDLRNSNDHISGTSSRSPQLPARQELHGAQLMGQAREHGGRKLHFPVTEQKEQHGGRGAESTTSQLPWPAAHQALEPKEGAHVPGAPSSVGSTEDEDTVTEGERFETEVKHRLRPLVPNGALRGFIARVARAMRKDCRLLQLQPSCTKLLAQTGQLLGRLGGQRAPQPAAQCLLRGNGSMGTAGRNRTTKGTAAHSSSRRVLLAVSVSLIITTYITAICLIEVCCPKPAAASQPQSTSKSRWRRFFRKLLPRRWCKNSGAQGSRFAERTKDEPQWLRDLYQPLDDLQRNSICQLYREPEEEEMSTAEPMMDTAPKEQHSPEPSAP